MPKLYSDADKKIILDFVQEYDLKHGRGGKVQASKEFKVSIQTIVSWLDYRSISKRIKQRDKKDIIINVYTAPDISLSIDKIEELKNQIAELKIKIDSEKQMLLKAIL